MRAHYFQHVPFEGLWSIQPWLESAGFTITRTAFFESPSPLPDIRDIDFLVIMGGPMSVNDTGLYPWLKEESGFIRRMADSGKPVLGICLGAQLIAHAMGSRVFPNTVKEIGWFPIHGERHGKTSAFSFPGEARVFHWHGETFDLPEGAVRLATSPACRNQAFQLEASVIGLQFHLETTPESARALVHNCGDELVPAPFIQNSQQILGAGPETYRAINLLMADILSFLNR